MKKVICFLILLLLFNCAEQEKDVIVTVNGSKLTKQEFEQYLPDVEINHKDRTTKKEKKQIFPVFR